MREIYSYSVEAQKAYDTAINILAVEYLIKTSNHEEYGRLGEVLTMLSDYELERLYVDLSLNMHVNNLGEMITHDDYGFQKELLFLFLDEKLEPAPLRRQRIKTFLKKG